MTNEGFQLQEHVQELCPSLKTTCPDCEATVFRKALREHIDACPEAIHSCAASKYGCPVKVKRAELVVHEQNCPLITMGPYFEAQNARLDSMELTIRHLQQRNEIFEDGLASIRSTLVESSRVMSARNPDIPAEANSQTRPSNSSGPANEQYDNSNASSNATTYLLALHESLREEVGQLSHAITDLDARASMAIMNECLRLKEDMAHTNAAVSSIRMQVQWLMNPRIHQSQRTGVRTNNSNNGNETRTGQLGSSASGPSSAAAAAPSPGFLRPRRLSDSGREGTKL